MSHWNYRTVKKRCPSTGETYYQIHEVHYNDKGEIIGVAKKPTVPQGCDEKGLQGDLSLLNIALDKPAIVLDEIEYGDPDWALGYASLDDFIFGNEIEQYKQTMPEQCREAIGRQPELGIGWSKEHHWFVADTKGLDPKGFHQHRSFMVKWSQRHYEDEDDILYNMVPYRVWMHVHDQMPKKCREVVGACIDGDDEVAGRGIGWNEELGWFVTELYDVDLVVIWSETGETDDDADSTT